MATGTLEADVAVIGAGIAGVAAGYELAGTASVLLLEAEHTPAYHTTGRSAAMFLQSYGGPAIRALTAASRADFDAAGTLLRPRPLLWVAGAGGLPGLATLGAANPELVPLDGPGTVARCPVLRPDWCAGGLLEPGALEIDVLGLHQRYLGGGRRRGMRVLVDAPVRAGAYRDGRWTLDTAAGPVRAAVVVNAAGAWADQVARRLGLAGLGLRPLVRTIVVARAPGLDRTLPLVTEVAEEFYFRPEGAGLLLSPADETPAEPGDVRPADEVVALALERVNAVTTLGLRSVHTAWAGLRTFAPDRVPVVGPDPVQPAFVWLAGQGGYGIQTAPALGRLAAAGVTGGTGGLLAALATALSPARLRGGGPAGG